MNELTRALYADPYLNVYRLVLNALAGVIAGALAVRFTQGRPYLHAMVATLPIYCVFISRYFAVYSVQYPAWSEFFAFALPVPFALLGARLQLHAVLAKRT